MKFQTYTPTESAILDGRKWYVVDATGLNLGRMAAQIALILRGKHKPIFAPHIDTGDFVIVINAEKLSVTGDRMETKLYRRHSQYPGGFKEFTLREMMNKRPERVIELAVKGMLPHNKLGRQMIKKLKVYKGGAHPHAAQKPEALEIPEAKK
jgi:large subunit ribosomal protein L13